MSILPADRATTWNPGLYAVGGIPIRTTIGATLSPLGGGLDDTSQINAAITACAAGQVVFLNAGTYKINTGNFIFLNKVITLRGAGPGQTILYKSDGAVPDSGNPGVSQSPVILMGTARYSPNGPFTTSSLSVDGAKGTFSITVASSTGFAAGNLVCLDELSGASWQPDPQGHGTSILASSDSRVVYQCHKILATDNIGTGNGATTTFSGTLSVLPVWSGTITVTAGAVTGVDDGLGHITGTGITSGTINYATGAVSVTFSAAPAGAVPVTVQFGHPFTFVDDPIAYDYLTGTIGNGSDAPSWFCRQDRPQCEIKKIQSVVGNVITFTTPLHIDYRTSHTAQIQIAEATPLARAGVEDLTVKGGDDGNIRMNWTDECWLKNVESTAWLNEGIAVYRSFRSELRQVYSHDACWPQPGGGGYAIALMGASAEPLIEDSISVMANKCIVSRCSGAGGVVGYCYMDNAFINTNGGWQEIGLNASHMVGPHHVLFEGNWGFNADSDHTHGNSTFITYFRNYLSGVRKSYVDPHDGLTYDDTSAGTTNGPLRCAGLMAFTYWCSFIGNVMGRKNKMSGWITNRTFSGSSPGVWMLGWDGISPYPVDANVDATTIRHGNYDFLNNVQTWDGTIVDHSIPTSYYLSSKPAAFTGGYTWPWTDPSNGTVGRLPAKDRFDGVDPPLATGPSASPALIFGFAGPAGFGRF